MHASIQTEQRRAFVKDQQFTPPNDSPRESEDLSLPNGQVCTSARDLRVERDARLIAFLLQIEEPCRAKCVIEKGIVVFGERVQVLAECPTEKFRLQGLVSMYCAMQEMTQVTDHLRDDGDIGAQSVKVELISC